jgi:WD40 repeat protein
MRIESYISRIFLFIAISCLLVATNASAYTNDPLWVLAINDKYDIDVNTVDISRDGSYIAAGTENNYVYLIDKSGQCLWKYSAKGAIYEVAISEDGQYVSAGGFDGNLYYFEKSGEMAWESPGGQIYELTMSDNGEYLAISRSNGNLIGIRRPCTIEYYNKEGLKIWDYSTNDWISSLDISPDGSYVAAGCHDNNVYFFNREGDLLWSFTTTDAVWSVSISADGSYVAAGGDDQKVHLISKSGQEIWRSPMYVYSDYYQSNRGTQVLDVEIIRDGPMVLAGGRGHNDLYYLYNATGYCMHATCKEDVYGVRDIEIDDNGRYFVTYSPTTGNDNIRVFDINGRNLWSFKTKNYQNCIAISGDGCYVVVGSNDGNIYFFSNTLQSGQTAPTFPVIGIISIILAAGILRKKDLSRDKR